MRPGTRALGIAESYSGSADESYATLAGAVVRADRVVDGIGFERTTVGGLDVTDAVCRLVDRDDIRYVLLSGIALSWYNLCDLQAVYDRIDRPILSVSYEDSTGLEPAIRREFEGESLRKRLEIYRSLPTRQSVSVDGNTIFVRSIGDVDTETVVQRFASGNGRPEPVRVARLAARAAHAYRHS
ncbi:endonuclease dU [Natranaeroarchaeum sulfidigenes]|uniref:UPF0215 protein AArcS_0760 n=1 Tax=Natranaeroarchaeum sulfidigenes TaxID=2784880 RepID=A0A897MN09_9EURY|nr:DUF99 family protein [Natranaeroarchaeum sulfidigenes]QSG01984.1 Endonuclease V-like protein [Natranaeroarchaeum sulfidigenes]